MKRLKIALLLFVATPLAGCASSHLIVEQPNRSMLTTRTLTLAYDETVTGVPQTASAYVQRKMAELFFGGQQRYFSEGPELTIRYHFVGFDQGSRMGRYLLGPLGVGEAQMVLEAQFVDPNGTVLAVVRGQSDVRGGFFGGSYNTAIDKAVKEIRDYAVAHFRGAGPRAPATR